MRHVEPIRTEAKKPNSDSYCVAVKFCYWVNPNKLLTYPILKPKYKRPCLIRERVRELILEIREREKKKERKGKK